MLFFVFKKKDCYNSKAILITEGKYMALFGKKKDDNSIENIEDIDEKILAAIDETDAEEEQRKADRKQAEIDRIAKQTAEREAAAEEAKKKATKIGRRFFIMPTSVEVGDNVLKATGAVFGKVKVEDNVYIYRPNGQVITSSVLSITSADDRNVVPEEGKVTAAEGAVVTIELGFKFGNVGLEPENIIPDYSIISNVRPAAAARKDIENPAILGLTCYYKEYAQDKKFNMVLVNHMVNSYFLLALHDSDRIGSNGKPAKQIVTILDKEDESKRMLPIFTDAIALMRSKDSIFNEEHKAQVSVLSFQEIVKNVLQEGIDFIINPYGPVAVRIPHDFISKLVNSESYQKRFGENGDAKRKYRKDTVTDGSKVAVGAPPNTEEVRAVRQALKDYCATVPSVKTAGLLCTIKKGEGPGYLIIFDIPKSGARDVFMGAAEVIKPFLNRIKRIEFSRYEETVFADQYFAQEPFDYVKNPNTAE